MIRIHQFTFLLLYVYGVSGVYAQTYDRREIFAVKFMQNEHCAFLMPCVGGFHTNS